MKKLGDREKKYVHMLNATLCATGRAICCLLETYQVRTYSYAPLYCTELFEYCSCLRTAWVSIFE